MLVQKDKKGGIDGQEKQNGNSFTPDGIERLRLELKNLQDRNMAEASFEEQLDFVAGLGIKVYPSEDLKSRRIKCGMDIRGIQKTGEQDGFVKVVYGRPCRSRTGDTLIKSKRHTCSRLNNYQERYLLHESLNPYLITQNSGELLPSISQIPLKVSKNSCFKPLTFYKLYVSLI